eukprot:477235-Rhodomonas_salina.3
MKSLFELSAKSGTCGFAACMLRLERNGLFARRKWGDQPLCLMSVLAGPAAALWGTRVGVVLWREIEFRQLWQVQF